MSLNIIIKNVTPKHGLLRVSKTNKQLPVTYPKQKEKENKKSTK